VDDNGVAMPTCKKPRRQYRPKPQIPGAHRPAPSHAMLVFEPLFKLFDQLETTGCLDDAAGSPIMQDWDGGWVEIAPALYGWADCWERIAEAEHMTIDLEPLRVIAKKLHLITPLTEQEVARGREAMLATHRAFLRLPVGAIKYYANTAELAFHLERCA
jgi:hypothetical protein